MTATTRRRLVRLANRAPEVLMLLGTAALGAGVLLLGGWRWW